MENHIKLTVEELKALRSYIAKRGFKEPALQVELLDHFACKVEEVLAEHPDMDLDTAMQTAYFSFGFNGFKNIAKALQAYAKKKYYTIYWREAKALIFSRLLPLFIALGYGSYRLLAYAALNNKYDALGFNAVADVMIYVIVMAIGYRGFIFNAKNKFYLKMANKATVIPFLATFFCFAVSSHKFPGGVVVSTVLAATFFTVFCIHYIADHKSLLVADREDKEVELLYKAG